jgi:dUTP pyrophosphatase
MDNIVIKFKKTHPDAVIPSQANDTDAGYDLVAVTEGKDFYKDENGNMVYLYTEYDTGIAIEPPEGYHTEIVPRSSLTKKNLILKNSFGVIDNSYRGNLICRFQKTGSENTPNVYIKGDKIAQLLIRKTLHAKFEEVNELSDTTRGTGGFGSSDNIRKF